MKKLFPLLFAGLLLLSLCACGNGNQTPAAPETAQQAENATAEPTEAGLDKNDPASYLGSWNSAHFTLTFNKGGIGQYTETYQGKTNSSYDFTYEVKDEVIIVTIEDSFLGTQISSFELNDDGTVLGIIQNGLPAYDPDVTEFIKDGN